MGHRRHSPHLTTRAAREAAMRRALEEACARPSACALLRERGARDRYVQVIVDDLDSAAGPTAILEIPTRRLPACALPPYSEATEAAFRAEGFHMMPAPQDPREPTPWPNWRKGCSLHSPAARAVVAAFVERLMALQGAPADWALEALVFETPPAPVR